MRHVRPRTERIVGAALRRQPTHFIVAELGQFVSIIAPDTAIGAWRVPSSFWATAVRFVPEFRLGLPTRATP